MKWWRRREASLDREIQDYLERETGDNLAAGMSPEQARYAARRKLGPELRVKEDTRAAWGWMWLERAWQDLRYGGRMLAQNPGFTLVAVISIALGVGANGAMFSVADMLLLRPLPVPRAGEVFTVGFVRSLGAVGTVNASYPDYVSLRDHSRSFEGLTAFAFMPLRFSIRPEAPPQLKMGAVVSGNFFEVMHVDPALGRAFRPDEDQAPGRDAVVVLSHDAWQQQFASDPSILGRKVRLNGIEFQVIGVAPDYFTGVEPFIRPAFYTPLMMFPRLSTETDALNLRGLRLFTIKGRMKPGVTLARAQAELSSMGANLAQAYPDTNRNQRLVARTELQYRNDQNGGDTMLIAMLLTLSAAVFLVACANVAGLLTSRAPVRAREMALRLAIGASRARLIRQLLTESLLLAALGGLLGLAVGYAGIMLFGQIQLPTDLVTFPPIALDRRAVVFSLTVAALSVLLFGLIPAIQTARADLTNTMKAGDAAAGKQRRAWGRSILVSGQVAITLVLLTTSAFIYRGFRHMVEQGPGSRTDHLVMMSFDPSLLRYNEAQTRRFYDQLVERASLLGGVKSAALASSVPMKNSVDGAAVVPEGYRFPAGQDRIQVFANRVDEHFFETLAITIVKGRGFLKTDTAERPRVAVVNELFAAHYWPAQDPIGKRFRLNDPNGPWVEIVGLTRTGKYLFIAEPPSEFVYLPERQDPAVARLTLLAESSGDSASLVAPLREMVRGIDPNQPIYDVRTMEELYQMRVVRTANIIVETVGAMGLMGLLLALGGLYGLVAYAVNRRTKEFGIRMAIGANSGEVLRLVVRQGAWLAVSGLALGLALSFTAGRLLKGVFPSTAGIDAVTYLLVAPALLAVTLLAAYIPARRASRVDPIKALKYE